MSNTFFGLPVEVWAAICLGVAAFYTMLWPRPVPGRVRPPLTAFILRWLHALTWVALALAALAVKYAGWTVAQVLALTGLACYIIFIVFLIRERTHMARK